ncbi:hypothetical protein AMELA_G00133820 [Ameiurus melas]|uniref:Neuronal acetylcholine receptor subunit alpha-7-like n=1 Tax=Ameiurus melas TaxID=219545 RepID=A0A7J6AIZ5_AMEME|nr:hypothetical protein AMELA_G00133820 [Ameiurus melas]
MGICGFALCLAVTACLWRASIQGEHQRRLYRDLMKDYNPLERPVFNDTQTLTVNFSFSLRQIMDVDEKNQVLTTNIWLQLYWFDHYLKWNVSEYPGVTSVRFPDSQIWKPDILLYNSADERFDATFHTNVLVSPNGACQYLPPGIFKSTCQIDVRWFPFDVQRCDLKFGSWTYGGWSLDLQMIEADITDYTANGEWDLVAVPGHRNERFYDCCKEPYPDVTFTVVMRRRTLYYGLNLLIPCVLISTLALLVFLLPADSGEKISLGITVLLSLTVFMLLVAEIMPATSDSVPLIAQYFATTMVIVGLSVIATVWVLQYHYHDPDGGKMPRWTGGGCARLMGMSDEAPSVSSGQGDTELSKILDEVRYIAKRFHDQDEEESLCSEWKFAASVIDRLCLMAFSMFTVLCTIGILMSAPNFVEAISKDFFT